MEDGGWRSGFLTRHAPRITHPRFEVLLKTFLRLETVGDDDNRSGWKKLSQQGRQKRLGRRVNAGIRQCAARLQSPCQGLHSGSPRNPVEQVVYRVSSCGICLGPARIHAACRRDLGILRQAWADSQRLAPASSFARASGARASRGRHSTILGTVNKPLACAGALRMAS